MTEELLEVCLHVENLSFTVKKNVLCEHSDYFRAMFSGSYVEEQQHDVTIDVDAVDANSMNIILRYMDLGLIDLSEYQLPVIGKLAVAANFLQIIELIKQIEYCLNLQLSISNWIEILVIAENAAYPKLEYSAATLGLLSFQTVKVQNIPSIPKLFWYLSHPYLNTSKELDVFKFGLQWVLCRETGADALLIILGCLDMKRLTVEELKQIQNDIIHHNFTNSLAEKVVGCLIKVYEDEKLSEEAVISKKDMLIQIFTARVFTEVLSLVKESKERRLVYTPVVPVWMLKDSKLEFAPHFMYTFSEDKGFDQWLEVADKNLWGWSVASWGPNKLVIVGGEHGRGTGSFMRDVKLYDTLKKEWIFHGVQLPQRRHGGASTMGDDLYYVGGVGGFRVTLETAIIYDMQQRSFRKISNLPDAIQSPAICVHQEGVYVAGQKNIYKYINTEDRWITAISTEMRTNRMTSYRDYIYCAQSYFSPMFRFKPGEDLQLQLITYYSHPPAAICNFNDRLIVFTRPMCGQSECISVEEYKENIEKPKILMTTYQSPFTINDVAGCCTLVIDIPPTQNQISSYHHKYLTRYCNA